MKLDRKEIKYGYFVIQAAVASNPNTSIKTLELLYQKNDIFVCQALATNPKTPIYILRNLFSKKKYSLHKYLVNYKEILDFQIIQENKDLLRQWVVEYNVSVLSMESSLAQNPNTPVDILDKLAKDRSYSTKYFLITNASTPLSTLMLVKTKKRDLRETVSDRICLIYQHLASNPETSIEQLKKMLKHQDVEVRLAVTQHPQGLGLLLDRCLKPERCLPEGNSLNRVLAGMHPAISQQQIDRLFNSDNWLDRLSVACNSKCSKEYLLQLTQDENDFVKQAARELLKRKD